MIPCLHAEQGGLDAGIGSDVGLSVTGVAGPDPQDGQPVGTVFFGLWISDTVIAGGVESAEQAKMPGDRDRIRQFSTISSLDMLRRRLKG